MTALVLGTKTFLQDFLVGWSLATGKIKNTCERIGRARAAQTLEVYGHYDIAKTLREGK